MSDTTVAKQSKGLNIALWVVQVLLAVAFGMAGSMKAFTPMDELAKKMPDLAAMGGLVRFIGFSELAGAIGILLPALTRILPILTPAAGVGLTVVMVLAVGSHVKAGDIGGSVPALVLGCLAAFVAWGRFRGAPITPRG